MKKVIKLGLMATLALGYTNAFSAQSLASAFEEGKVSGEIKSQYLDKWW